ncbi:transcriptional regulator [Pedobacter sp. ISL-68]|uniref:ligand-binding sensor domain-containing protein n=1 Tax=unclassified Pedobacter TaxID=2628915 RepID=UPI001BEA0856|nr:MULTISPECIES: triple tyrosine motif-containing protein [unclassified Pedobacter]MBT2563381.1 transcriptional regulator [Pedobacter sp. ISL-64]MBT2588864.1 transcriptional regulator [Pedobacter sp. ISL-68]
MNKLLLAIIFCLIGYGVHAQDLLAIPQIVNYNNEQYNAGIQNWDVEQDRNGMLYFGNNEGLLTFNGRYWNLFRLPNYTSVRSVGIDSKNRIYVGGQDEFGYFYPNAQGVLKYTSLLNLLPESMRKLADIWGVSIINDEVFFRSIHAILHYKDGVIKSYKTTTTWLFMGMANNKVFSQSSDSGLMIYDHEMWKPFCSDSVLNRSSITAVLPYGGDTLLVSVLKKGFFLVVNHQLIPLKTKLDQVFLNDRIYFTNQISQHLYGVATTSGGVYIMNSKGELVQKYNYREGLQNNNVRGILIDRDKNMWLALDDGIAYVAINSAVKNIFPDRNKQITSYAFRKFNQSIYIGTSNGLYRAKVSSGVQDLSYSPAYFEEVKNTKGQVWGLDEINNQLLMAHEDGTLLVEDNVARPIYSLIGTWMYQTPDNIYPSSEVIAGTYAGLQKITYNNSSFINAGKIGGIAETLRFIVADNNNPDRIWASHPYHGVYKIELQPDHKRVLRTTLYTDKSGLPSKLYNYVFHIKNRVVIATSDGIYEYDEGRQKFVRFKLLANVLNGVSVQYMKEDGDGNIWFVSNKKVGVIDFKHPSGANPFTIFYLPELDGKVVGGFESIYTLDSKNIFIGANKGAYHINYEKYIQNITKPIVTLGQVKLLGNKDSLVFGGYFVSKGVISAKQDQQEIPEYINSLNSIHFEYASTLFEHDKNIKFSYQLVGFDREWSAWGTKSEKDYTNLPAGKYTFNIKARTDVGNESVVVGYTFVVLPAWYNTIWMRIFYLILVVLLIRLIIKWQKRKHIKEQERMSYLHQLELDRNEKEIVRLQNEKLEADVNYKNKELSTMTMHLVQRGKVLAKIKEVISAVIKNHDINESSPSFRHLIRLIRDVEKKDQELDHLSVHFNHVNTEFFNKLKDLYPDLSQNDLKFCAYLSMNLSSKEMAQLMNVTIKAIEVGRYRLRKKLQLKPETNLYEFLINIARQKTS